MKYLELACAGNPRAMAWLSQLPAAISRLTSEWGLRLEPPLTEDATCAWVAPGEDSAGRAIVLKLGVPHMEAEDESRGLRLWNGQGAARLLSYDAPSNAMLLERVLPGDRLRLEPEERQDEVIAALLQRLWAHSTGPRAARQGFRHLSQMIDVWMASTRKATDRWIDAELVRQGLAMMTLLSTPADGDVLLVTDLHAGNVLRAQEPDVTQTASEAWKVIDPKPFIGDPAYDATQHLFNCPARMADRPLETIDRVAGLLGIAPERVRAWTFARAAAESCRVDNPASVRLARAIAP